MKHIVIWLTIVTVWLIHLSSNPVLSATEKRIALVFGNGEYKSAPLRNPVNDARDMADALEKLGFSVSLKTDTDQRNMKQAIRAFGKQLRKGGVGLFYFAGHGIQVKGTNYLIPIGAQIESEADVEYEAVDAGRVLAQMEEAENSLNIIILDACRDNPFARSFRSSGRGLAKMDAPTGSILAYATAPGSIASDGSGRNGLYTAALLKHMKTPGLEIGRLFRQVRIDVLSSSGKKQVPWEASSLTGDFYFHSGRGISVVPKQPVKQAPKYAAISPEATEPKATTKKKIKNSLGMEFVYIKPGTFMMGSPSNEKYRHDNEKQHRVTLTQGFYMQTTEVTQRQWKAVMGTRPWSGKEYKVKAGDNYPAVYISWDDCQVFIKKINQMEGGDKYRLPTEAEREYACRAGTTTQFYFGDDEGRLGEYAWYGGNSGGRTHPVAQKNPNSWGLYDLYGNVGEWCQDWYGDYPSGFVTDPKGPSSGSLRVRRGGSFSIKPRGARSANRSRNVPDRRGSYLGFRLLSTN